MFLFKRIKIRSYEVGLYFREGEFKGLLGAGRHWLFDPFGKVRVDVVSQREPWLRHDKLDVVVKSGALAGKAEVVDLKDYQRALVWIDGRLPRTDRAAVLRVEGQHQILSVHNIGQVDRGSVLSHPRELRSFVANLKHCSHDFDIGFATAPVGL